MADDFWWDTTGVFKNLLGADDELRQAAGAVGRSVGGDLNPPQGMVGRTPDGRKVTMTLEAYDDSPMRRARNLRGARPVPLPDEPPKLPPLQMTQSRATSPLPDLGDLRGGDGLPLLSALLNPSEWSAESLRRAYRQQVGNLAKPLIAPRAQPHPGAAPLSADWFTNLGVGAASAVPEALSYLLPVYGPAKAMAQGLFANERFKDLATETKRRAVAGDRTGADEAYRAAGQSAGDAALSMLPMLPSAYRAVAGSMTNSAVGSVPGVAAQVVRRSRPAPVRPSTGLPAPSRLGTAALVAGNLPGAPVGDLLTGNDPTEFVRQMYAEDPAGLVAMAFGVGGLAHMGANAAKGFNPANPVALAGAAKSLPRALDASSFNWMRDNGIGQTLGSGPAFYRKLAAEGRLYSKQPTRAKVPDLPEGTIERDLSGAPPGAFMRVPMSGKAPGREPGVTSSMYVQKTGSDRSQFGQASIEKIRNAPGVNFFDGTPLADRPRVGAMAVEDLGADVLRPRKVLDWLMNSKRPEVAALRDLYPELDPAIESQVKQIPLEAWFRDGVVHPDNIMPVGSIPYDGQATTGMGMRALNQHQSNLAPSEGGWAFPLTGGVQGATLGGTPVTPTLASVTQGQVSGTISRQNAIGSGLAMVQRGSPHMLTSNPANTLHLINSINDRLAKDPAYAARREQIDDAVVQAVESVRRDAEKKGGKALPGFDVEADDALGQWLRLYKDDGWLFDTRRSMIERLTGTKGINKNIKGFGRLFPMFDNLARSGTDPRWPIELFDGYGWTQGMMDIDRVENPAKGVFDAPTLGVPGVHSYPKIALGRGTRGITPKTVNAADEIFGFKPNEFASWNTRRPGFLPTPEWLEWLYDLPEGYIAGRKYYGDGQNGVADSPSTVHDRGDQRADPADRPGGRRPAGYGGGVLGGQDAAGGAFPLDEGAAVRPDGGVDGRGAGRGVSTDAGGLAEPGGGVAGVQGPVDAGTGGTGPARTPAGPDSVPVRSDFAASVVEFADQAANAARERMRQRRGQLNEGATALAAEIADWSVIGASHVAKGVVNFSEWSARMVGEFGERIRPHLDDVWKRSQAIGTLTNKSFSEIEAGVQSMSHWRDWYDRYGAYIEELFGGNANTFLRFMSVTSQAASVKANVGLAVKAYGQWLSGMPFDQRYAKTGKQGYLPAVAGNLNRVVNDEAAGGRKIGNFDEANANGNADGIAIDRHVSRVMYGTDAPGALYDAAVLVVKTIADRMGWEGKQVQAAIWAWNQKLEGTNENEIGSYDAVLAEPRIQQRLANLAAEFGIDAVRPGGAAGDTGGDRGGAQVAATGAARGVPGDDPAWPFTVAPAKDPARSNDELIGRGRFAESPEAARARAPKELREAVKALAEQEKLVAERTADLRSTVPGSKAARDAKKKLDKATKTLEVKKQRLAKAQAWDAEVKRNPDAMPTYDDSLDQLESDLVTPDQPATPAGPDSTPGERPWWDALGVMGHLGETLNMGVGPTPDGEAPIDLPRTMAGLRRRRYEASQKGTPEGPTAPVQASQAPAGPRTPFVESTGQQAMDLGQKPPNPKPGLGQRLASNPVVELFADARTLKASGDLSGWAAQGGKVLFAHPVLGARAFGAMLRAARSEENAKAISKQIDDRQMSLYGDPDYYAKVGLDRTNTFARQAPTTMAEREEAFASSRVEKIPGVGGMVKVSDRAYGIVLDRMRADLFDLLHRDGMSVEEARDIARYVNVATGRGDLSKKVADAMPAAATAFFAPRYQASNIQYLAGQPIMRASTPQTRKIVAGEYARYVMGVAAFMGAAKLAGGEVETDPRSTDFLKVNVGGVKLDPIGSIRGYMVLGARAGLPLYNRVTGQRPDRPNFVSQAGRQSFKQPSDLAKDFVGNKVSPIVGGVRDLLDTKDGGGNPTSPGRSLVNMFSPIGPSQLVENVVASEGDQEKMARAAVAFLISSVGLQSDVEKARKGGGGGGGLPGLGGGLPKLPGLTGGATGLPGLR